MDFKQNAAAIAQGETVLGIELGSTRIKAVLINRDFETIASGSCTWENELKDGVWTYALSSVWTGVQTCYAALSADVESHYQMALERIGAIGISAMMHGYLPFDSGGTQLVEFRTWRNNTTGAAADILTEKFHFNIPQRWSIAHLYQALLNGEAHVKEIDFITTLAGYVHWQLSGEKVLGIGDASGMFPIDEGTGTYDADMLAAFSELPEVGACPWQIAEILPRALRAGETAGRLTAEGARLLDPSGKLTAGALMAPPEGDAGTGMVSTNAVRKCMGNISVGTSAFSMNVLEQPLRHVHRDIDIVTTPAGAPVAMVHTNNCSSDLNAWMGLFRDFATYLGDETAADEVYRLLFECTAKADADAGGLLSYNCLSGENITEVESGRPLFVRTPHSRMNLPNFMLAQLYAAFAPLKIGMDILVREEGIRTEVMIAHGGLFKTPLIAQQVLSNALDLPITVMDTAGEGGAWGMAVLASFAAREEKASLVDFLDSEVFHDAAGTTLTPEASGVAGCTQFIARYRTALSIEQAAAVLADE